MSRARGLFRTAPEYFYFGRFDPWAKRHHADWTTQDRKNTREYIWYNDFNFRQPFETAKKSLGNIPPWNPTIVPAQPYNKAQRDEAFRRAKSGAQTEYNPTGVQNVSPQPQPALPQGVVTTGAQHQDRYPFSFWPPLPWGEEPEIQLPPTARKPSDFSDDDLSDAEIERLEKAEMEKWKREWLEGGLFPPSEWGNDSDTWVGTKFLGKGGYGSAGLWEKKDKDGNVLDQVVCKDQVYPTEVHWRDPTIWRQGLPQEIALHRIIDNERRKQNPKAYRSIIKHRGYRLLMSKRRFRLYLQYLPKADLSIGMRDRFLLMRGKRRWNTDRWKSRDPPPPPKHILPESFIWHVFRELVRAVMVLKHGHEDEQRYPRDWRPIVHRDITLSNIILDDRKPGDEFHESWPRVVLADFGIGFYEFVTGHSLPTNLRDNPREYKLLGMNRVGDWRYPVENHFQYKEDAPITDKSDVFQIASIIYDLMDHCHNTNGPYFANTRLKNSWEKNFEHLQSHDVFFEVDDLDTLHMEYTEDLCNLVDFCLKAKPEDRPTIEEVKKALEERYACVRDEVEDEYTEQDPDLLSQEDASHEAFDLRNW